MELLHQLARDNNVHLKEKPKNNERVLVVMTRAQVRRMVSN